MVSEVDRLGERLERQRVLGQAGHGRDPRHRPEREHELLPAHGLLRAGIRLERRRARLEVHTRGTAEQ